MAVHSGSKRSGKEIRRSQNESIAKNTCSFCKSLKMNDVPAVRRPSKPSRGRTSRRGTDGCAVRRAAREGSRITRDGHPALPHLGFVWIRNAAVETGAAQDSASAAPRRRPQKSSHALRRAASRPRERVLRSAQPAPTPDGRRRARALAPTSSPGPAMASLTWLLRSDARCVLAQSSCCPAALLWGD